MNVQTGILDASAQAHIADYIDSRPSRHIIAATAAYFEFRPRDILSAELYRPVARARIVAMALVRKHSKLSFPDIGRRFGRHHTTVLSACRRFEFLRGTDEKFRTDTDTIETLILRLIGTAGGEA